MRGLPSIAVLPPLLGKNCPRVRPTPKKNTSIQELTPGDGILDFVAERDGDTDTRIALRAKDLSSSSCYYQLAEFCLSHRRKAHALKWARAEGS